jgi:tetratricopeptide (TPR) repeat protein
LSDFSPKTKIKKMRIFWIISCFIPFVAFANANFQEANSEYKNGNFAVASQKYEAILKQDIASQELYYNLGNAYFKQNQIGKSVLNYERALLYGANEDISYNLSIARDKVKNEPELIQPFFLRRWWDGLRRLASVDTWSILSILLLWTSIGGFCFWLLAVEREHKKRGFITGTVLLPLSLIAFLAARSNRYNLCERKNAVVMVENTVVRSAPDELGTSVETLGEGVKLTVLDQIGSWYKVQLSNGEQGWLTLNQIEKI